MISGKILGKIWENLGRIGAEKGAKIVLSNDWEHTVMRTPKNTEVSASQTVRTG
nr:MAG TPA: hypothetical protein [Caudoviricetes sp.]